MITKIKWFLLKWLLRDERVYSLATALRSMDGGSEQAKMLFAARLRAWAGLGHKAIVTRQHEVPTWALRSQKIVEQAIRDLQSEMACKSTCHWLAHTARGLDAIVAFDPKNEEARALLTLALCILSGHEEEALQVTQKYGRDYLGLED